ncbi:aminodeoxychorismate lyase [Shewanella algae]|uniref:endolytic transglycosylase MltG n=1 Tax=Shewanella algae TaxID=38313 RepID=UPI001BEEAB89|nr:endolytic transglycosylase MltG [Shewanella algae]BCV58421.1 aminodeoxychorismate lyase [Shewanella algae]
MKKCLVAALAFVFTLMTLALGVGFWGYNELNRFAVTELKLDEPRELLLKRGTSFYQLGQELQNQQLLEFDWHWKLWGKLYPQMTAIRSGLYQIEPGDTPVSLLERLVAGDEKTFTLTLVEGKTIREWQAYLQTLAYLKVSDKPFIDVLEAQGDNSGLPEGKFFPDTYQYRAGTELNTLLTQSFIKMQQQLESIWQQRDQSIPLKSPYELLILASIIEKETGLAEERGKIAAVFVNRLKKRMRLQTDPTVIYGMGERFDGNITRKDLREETPFNTYRIFGLPPTPIAAPGREALLAAAHPEAVEYLYFVSRNDGSHVFSRTLAEHNRAVNQYQRKR